MDLDSLPDGWEVWDHEPDRSLILTFRPDVFDGSELPSSCLPTIYVREGRKDLRRAGPQPEAGTEGNWTVTLFLEPQVSETLDDCSSMSTAIDAAIEQANAFSRGKIDLTAIYHDPREGYLETINELIGDP